MIGLVYGLVFGSVMYIMFNIFIFSAYFYVKDESEDTQSSLLNTLKGAIQILLMLDTIILMVLIYLFSLI